MSANSTVSGYSTGEVARLLGVSQNQVRSYVRAGFLRPRRGPRNAYRFNFQDLVILRAAQGLRAANVPTRKVLAALRTLQEELPSGRSLASVRVTADGSRVRVHRGGDTWEPETGQLVLDLETGELAKKAAPLAMVQMERVRRADEELSAEGWFELGLELEATSLREARKAYTRALDLAPWMADAHINLGRLLHEAGEVEKAEGHYLDARRLEPDSATSNFNLGVAWQDLGRNEEAVAAYQRAVRLDPTYADAYFNLAFLYERLGEKAVAIRTLKIYKALQGG